MNKLSIKTHILVLGIGNLLMQDDGVGIHCIEYLEETGVQENIDLIDGGTGGLALLDFLNEYEKIYVIDAVDMKAPPGTIKIFSPDEIQMYSSHLTLSAHGIGFAEVMAIQKEIDKLPDIKIIGIQPNTISYNLQLSPAVKKVLPKIKKILVEQIRKNSEE